MLDHRWTYLFPDIETKSESGSGNIQVKCPFHPDTHESGGIQTEDNLFNCFTCGMKGTINQLFPGFKHKIIKKVNLPEWYNNQSIISNQVIANTWKFNTEVLDSLQIKRLSNEEFSCPIFLTIGNHSFLVDVRSYYPNGIPKWMGRPNSSSGLIFGEQFINDKYDKTPIVICAGEKDMLIARSHGLNAVSLTGGETALPYTLEYFKGKEIIIAFDNDETGIKGSENLAIHFIKNKINKVKVLKNIFEVIKNPKEDIYDFFIKYNKTKEDIDKYISEEEYFVIPEEAFRKGTREINSINKALQQEYRNTLLRSKVLVVSRFQVAKTVISELHATVEVGQQGGSNNEFKQVVWKLDINNYEKIFDFMEGKSKWNTLKRRLIENRTHVPHGQEIVRVKYNIIKEATIRSYLVRDIEFENSETSELKNPNPICIYLCDEFVESEVLLNQALEIIYKVGSNLKTELGFLIRDYKKADYFLESFSYTKEVQKSLEKFKPIPTFKNGKIIYNVEEKLKELWNRAKNFTANFISFDLFLTNEFVFNSIWNFKLGPHIRSGPLDVLVVGNTEAGKSTVSTGMVNTYRQGKVINVSNATTTALIGGQYTQDKIKFTQLGIVPQQHKKLVIFEEYQAAETDFIKKYRDVRTRGIIDIGRVQEQLVSPCRVRSLIISNTKNGGGVQEFTNGGYEIVKQFDLEHADIGRFHFVQILKESEYVRPNQGLDIKAFDNIDYQNRLKWAWTRGYEDVIISKELENHIYDKVPILEKKFALNDFHLVSKKIDHKLCGIALAIAATLGSCNDEGKLVLRFEHVDYAETFLNNLYTNELFALDKLKAEKMEKEASAVTPHDIEQLRILDSQGQDSALKHLFKHNQMMKNDFKDLCEFATESIFRNVFKTLEKNNFFELVKIKGMNHMKPTNKYKEAYRQFQSKIEKGEIFVEPKPL